MLRLVLMAAAVTAAGVTAAPLPAFALSDVASELVAQEVKAACGGGLGRYDPAFVVERDLDGDGMADLVVAHEGIECASAPRSAECGEILCRIRLWLRRGDQFTPALGDVRGYDMTIGQGPTPEIRWVGEGGAPTTIRWDGEAFR